MARLIDRFEFDGCTCSIEHGLKEAVAMVGVDRDG